MLQEKRAHSWWYEIVNFNDAEYHDAAVTYKANYAYDLIKVSL